MQEDIKEVEKQGEKEVVAPKGTEDKQLLYTFTRQEMSEFTSEIISKLLTQLNIQQPNNDNRDAFEGISFGGSK